MCSLVGLRRCFAAVHSRRLLRAAGISDPDVIPSAQDDPSHSPLSFVVTSFFGRPTNREFSIPVSCESHHGAPLDVLSFPRESHSLAASKTAGFLHSQESEHSAIPDPSSLPHGAHPRDHLNESLLVPNPHQSRGDSCPRGRDP